MKINLILSLLLLLISFSCSKEQRFSNRLQKGEFWSVKSISIGGTLSEGYPGKWEIKTDVNIEEKVPTLIWRRGGESSICEWQFQEKGNKLQLNYFHLCEESDTNLIDSLAFNIYNLSGKYSVERKSRKHMKFSSSETNSFSNQKVIIEIERE